MNNDNNNSKETAGSQPLTNSVHESFVIAVATGMSKRAAYKEFISKDCSNKSAKELASRLFARSEIRERLTYINKQSKRLTGRLSREELRRILEVLATSGSSADKLNAVKQLKDWDDDDERKRADNATLDPATIAHRLSMYQGAPATAEHLHAVVERLAALLNVSLAQVVQACKDRDDATLTPHISDSAPADTPKSP